MPDPFAWIMGCPWDVSGRHDIDPMNETCRKCDQTQDMIVSESNEWLMENVINPARVRIGLKPYPQIGAHGDLT